MGIEFFMNLKKTDFNYCYISPWGKITLFVHKFTWIRYMNKCEICEKCDFVENVSFVNLVKHVNLVKTMRILWKCEFVENLNFWILWFEFCGKFEFCEKVWIMWKSMIFNIWISWKMRFSTCEFLDSFWFFAPVWRLKSSPWILTMWKYIKVKPLKILKIIISSFPLSGLVFGWPEHFSSTAFNIGEFWMAWPRVTFAVIESALLTVKGSLLLCRLLVVGICTLTQTTPWE